MDVEDIESEEPKHKGKEATVCFDSIIEYAAERLAYSVRKYALKNELSLILYGEIKDKPGIPVKRIASRSFERLLAKARTLLKERSLTCSKEAREESIGFYENMLADPETPPFVRIKARENLDKIKTQVDPGSQSKSEQVIDLNEIDIIIRKKILNDMRNPSSSD